MKRLFLLWLLVCFVVSVPAQQKRTAATKARTTTTKQTTRKSATKKNTKKRTTAKKKTMTKAKQPTVSGLKKEQQQVRNTIKKAKSIC